MRLSLLFIFCISSLCFAQPNPSYWQQKADYTMQVKVDVEKHQYSGKEEIKYANNSPDTLKKVFFHLYFNAFQPGSEMDIRSLTIRDADKRVGDRISKLKPSERGYLEIDNFTLNGQKLDYEVKGTIVEVALKSFILPKEEVRFQLDFEGQIPKQIRRSGRNNKEGISYSMTQWFPKIAAYDERGWHANPYIGREFFSPFGNYDVKIEIDSKYSIGGTGVLQPFGSAQGSNTNENKRTWHFKGEGIHDFAWAADPDYVHDVQTFGNGKKMHFYYQNEPKIRENWKKLQPIALKLMDFYETHIGPYPYPQYSIIQGGDGGMEYAMCTLITGDRNFGSLVGVTAHEMAHAWFQHIIGTDEANYEWMDEGFTTYISTLSEDYVMNKNKDFPNESSYKGYIQLVDSGAEQPQTTHADRYKYNYAYGISAYSKGSIFLDQLGGIIGDEILAKTLRTYYQQWKFKHPKPNDFIRVAEKVSGLELDWYLQDWTRTTNTIDYGISAVDQENNKTKISLQRIGLMPAPMTVEVIYKKGSKEHFLIPLRMMRGNRPLKSQEKLLSDWAWAYPTYSFEIPVKKKKIKEVRLNSSGRIADVNSKNDVFVVK